MNQNEIKTGDNAEASEGLELDVEKYSELYLKELTEQIIPFWENNSVDEENGGYFTCLTATGEVYDTDKFMWLQARQIWMFSKFFLELEPNKERWREIAKKGIDFVQVYGQDREESEDWYFSLTAEGMPLVAPYNIFSDCFVAMAFGEYYKIDPNPEYKDVAKNTFERILDRQDNPKGVYNKVLGARPMMNFALPMILCNLAMELEHIIGPEKVTSLNKILVPLVMEKFYDEKTGLIHENVSPDGSFVDSFEGRLLNPGHAIEAMWFIMNIGIKEADSALVEKAESIMYKQLEHGWDEEFGGIFYFLDAKGKPPQQLEWDQKLWWVHLETLVALAKVYTYNKSPKAAEWFVKVHNYVWDHFRDPVNKGEWFGYLNRRGEVLLTLKGGKWKGCFHVPRALFEVSTTFKGKLL